MNEIHRDEHGEYINVYLPFEPPWGQDWKHASIWIHKDSVDEEEFNSIVVYDKNGNNVSHDVFSMDLDVIDLR